MWWKRPSLESLIAHSPISVARFLLREAEARGFAVTPMKLLKMVFLSHGWMLGLHGIPLVRGPVEAWRYGPVFPDLYRLIRHLGTQSVTASDLPAEPKEVFEEEARRVMVGSVERYGPLSASELAEITGAPSSPWELTYRRGGWKPRIRPELIEFYYRKMLEVAGKYEEAEAAS